MNSALLMGQFDRISDAPDAVARLRRFVLGLAVRGKLVDQNADEEPASHLLKRIGAKRAQLTGNEGKKESIARFVGGDAPFEIPPSWLWVSLGDICSKTGSGSTPRGGKSVYQREGVVFLRSQNVYNDGLHLDDVAYISHQTNEKMSGTVVRPHDLLLNITGGSIGRCCHVSSEIVLANVSQHVAIIRVALDGTERYLHRLILSPYFQAFILSEQTGAGRGGLPKNRMDRIPVALPPLAEQFRIVAKVDELITLCDRLESAQAARESARSLVTTSSLHHLNNSSNGTAIRKHADFYLSHLSRFIARPDQIKELRQTILDLAVRGRLVSQDPSDEPADLLLRRIEMKTEQSLNKGATRRSIVRRQSSDKLRPFELPCGWTWVHLQQLLEPNRDISYGVIKLGDEPRDGGVFTLRCSDVKPRALDLTGIRRVSEEIEQNYIRTRLVGGEIVLNIRGTLGGVALIPSELRGYNVAREVAVIPVSQELSAPYMVSVMASPYFWEAILQSVRGIAYKGLNLSLLRLFEIPLPPSAEQHRIVAKVDELMGLCDRLEKQLTSAQAESGHLLEAILDQALNESREQSDALAKSYG